MITNFRFSDTSHGNARLIEGGIPTEALVAHVLVARYADQLPLIARRR